MPLVAVDDFEGLPKEPIARWLQLRDLIEKRLDSYCDMNNGGNEKGDLLSYVHVLSAAADELGVGSLAEVSPANIHEEIDLFRASVAALATRLSLRLSHSSSEHFVALGRPTRKKILGEVETLRALIRNSELSEDQKTKASAKLNQLQILIIAAKTDIARVGVLLAGIGAFTVASTSFFADAPNALGTISALVGGDKLEEESEQTLIEGVRAKLQIQDLREATGNDASFDIPF